VEEEAVAEDEEEEEEEEGTYCRLSSLISNRFKFDSHHTNQSKPVLS
jgi:hypothetical protein